VERKLSDKHIFKYTSYDIGEIIITSQLLKFNSPNFFNDPFDCITDLLYFDFENIGNDVLQDWNKMKSKCDFPEISTNIKEKAYRNLTERKINESSICCFSLNMKNTVMWSHYANNHNGICLIFDRSCNEPFADFSLERFSRNKVDYDNYVPINYLKSKREGIERLFFTKSADWEYEKEYRYVLKEKYGFVKFNKQFLKGIIFGLNVNVENIERLKKLCLKSNYEDLLFGHFKKEKLNMKLYEL
jgi:hypothetical protein